MGGDVIMIHSGHKDFYSEGLSKALGRSKKQFNTHDRKWESCRIFLEEYFERNILKLC